VGYLELVPHTNKIWDTLLKFRDSHRESVPSGAAESLNAALSRRTSFSSLKAGNAPEFLQVMVTVLASFRAEFE